MISSRGITVIVLENTSEARFAFDLAGIKRNDVVFVVRFPTRQRQQTIIQALMRSALKIIGNVLGNEWHCRLRRKGLGELALKASF